MRIISLIYPKYEKEYPTESDLKGIKTYITYIKNMMLTDEEIRALEKEAGCHLLDIYKNYCEELKNRKCMDYDDQMIYAYRLLKSAPWLLDYYQNLYPYICVDEAMAGSEIKGILLESRVAQYVYLLRMAGDCKEQTAVLYRDNESVIPLVDLLERNNVQYQIRNAELSFFTNRIVVDI